MLSTTDAVETWVPLHNYEGLYEVSNFGNIRAATDIIYKSGSRFGQKGAVAHKKWDILPLVKGTYYRVSIYDTRLNHAPRSKNFYVHECVSSSFQGHDDGCVVDHIDGNKHNNHLTNLQRISHVDNCRKAYANDESLRWTNRKSGVVRDDGVVYANLLEAISKNGIKDTPCIINAIRRKTKCAGYYWEYADTEKQKKITERYTYSKISSCNKSAWVRCIDTGEVMLNSDMERIFGVADGVIYSAIRFNDGYSAFLNKSFEFVDDDDIDYLSQSIQAYIKRSHRMRNTRVMCIETGIVYMNMTHAAQSLGISVDYIKRSVRENYTGKCGLTFKKA